MTETASTTRISQVGTVFIPVADQDRALEFYLDKLGFEKRADFPYGEGSRWVEVAPPGSAIAIALVPPSEGEPAGGDQAHCAFATEDIEADHATLCARGVDVDAEIARAGKRRPRARLDRGHHQGSRAVPVLLPRHRWEPLPDGRARLT
jgi:catechol 2,3-dioxygenase-like lactoylglutathione lyase family enzyme